MKDDFKTLRQLGWASAILFSIWYVLTEPANASGFNETENKPCTDLLPLDERLYCNHTGSTVSIASRNCFTSAAEL